MSKEEECLDHTICQQMSSLVELLTTSGKPVLNPEIMKKFKKICRTSDMYIEHAFHLLMSQLSTDHSEVRLSTFQIIDELFVRSHAFRELLVADFQTFLELAVGINQDSPLPLPKFAAQTLKNQAYKSIQQWYEKFGEAYKKLILGYQFLKTCKKVDFDGIQARTELERRQKEEAERKVAESRKIRVDKVLNEMKERCIDIELCVTEIENSIQLLLPHPDDFFISVPEQTQSYSVSKTVSKDSGNSVADKSSSETKTSTDSGTSKDPSARSEKIPGVDSIKCLDTNVPGVSVESDKITLTKDSTTKSVHNLESSEKCEKYVHDKKKSNTYEDKCREEENLEKDIDSVERTNDCDDVKRNDNGENKEVNENSSDDEEEEDDDDDDDFETVSDSTNPLRHQLGLFKHEYSITVEMENSESKLKETEDNKEIIQGLREQYRLVKVKYLPSVKRWMQVMTKNGAKQDNIKAVIDLKTKLEEAARKCIELEIVTSTNKDQSSSESEEEFEDVQEKEGYEADIPEHVRLEAVRSKAISTPMGKGSGKKRKRKAAAAKEDVPGKSSLSYWKLSERVQEEDERDPTTWKSNVNKLQQNSNATSTVTSGMIKQEPGTSGSTDTSTKKQGLLEKAPVISYGVDIEHWEDPSKIKAPMKVKNDDARVWTGNSLDTDEVSSSFEVETLTTRSFTFAGKFEPVKWKCRAPLLNGKLCERMDRVKCPFHGKIIARDEEGKPKNPADVSSQDIKTPVQDLAVDWQDPELLADIEAQTGVDLGSSKGKGKGKGKGKKKAEKRKYPNLTDIKESKNNSRKRLESKIFKRGTLKKVNAALDAVTTKRLADKFGNQFNYSLH